MELFTSIIQIFFSLTMHQWVKGKISSFSEEIYKLSISIVKRYIKVKWKKKCENECLEIKLSDQVGGV